MERLRTRSVELLGILLDKNAESGDRDDAAMELENLPSTQVVQALQEVAEDSASPKFLVESCLESIQAIRRLNKQRF